MADKITPGQIRAARAMLDWSMVDLATASSVSISTIKRAEDEHSSYGINRSIPSIRLAFEIEGVSFLQDDGNGPGVRYKGR